MIDPRAYVEQGVTLGKGVQIAPFAVVHRGASLGDGVSIGAHCVIGGSVRIGQGTQVFPGAILGLSPQDLKYCGHQGSVTIGARCTIREYVTIHQPTVGATVVEDNCFLMAYVHIAHDVHVGEGAILSNGTTLAGHVSVGSMAILGGQCACHQFVQIGAHAMVGGMTAVRRDISPFTIGRGDPYRMGGLNLVGLKRRGFSLHERKVLTQVFQLLYRTQLPLKTAIARIEKDVPRTTHVETWLNFLKHSRRGLAGRATHV